MSESKGEVLKEQTFELAKKVTPAAAPFVILGGLAIAGLAYIGIDSVRMLADVLRKQ